MCFSEHHMCQEELQTIYFDSYNLRGSYCRSSYAKGGVCIFVKEGIECTCLELTRFCEDKDFKACACKIYTNSKRICIIALYRAPIGNFDSFLTKLDNILGYLYTNTLDFIILGDINLNYLVDSSRKSQLEVLLSTYNLTGLINFPTRIQKKISYSDRQHFPGL